MTFLYLHFIEGVCKATIDQVVAQQPTTGGFISVYIYVTVIKSLKETSCAVSSMAGRKTHLIPKHPFRG